MAAQFIHVHTHSYFSFLEGLIDPVFLARKAAEWGARVIEFGPKAYVNDLYFPVSTPGVESFASLVLVPPAALLAYRLARRRGHDPNRLAWNTSLPTAALGGVSAYLAQIRDVLDDLVKSYSPAGIGMALPGFLRQDRRAIAYNPNTPALVGVDFAALAETYGLPVHIEPDLNVPALAEYFYGAGRGIGRLMTGVIGAAVPILFGL